MYTYAHMDIDIDTHEDTHTSIHILHMCIYKDMYMYIAIYIYGNTFGIDLYQNKAAFPKPVPSVRSIPYG